MLFTCTPTKIELFDNSKLWLTMSQVKARTGCQLIINGGYFGGALNPYGNIKINGDWVHREPWDIEGFVWDSGKMPTMDLTRFSTKANVYSCVPVIKEGHAMAVNNNDKEVGGWRGRSGWGVKQNGSFVFMCTSDAKEPMQLSQARSKLLEAGCVSAILNDGGASCQMSCPAGTVAGGRKVSNFICVWLDNQGKGKEDDGKEAEPIAKKYKVCLDPGHGTGELNCSPDKSYYEYKFAWDMANRVKELLLQTECFDVKLTKKNMNETPTLSARAATANNFGADVFVSIHSNAISNTGWNDSIHGLTAWIYAEGGKRQELAKHLLEQFEVQGVELFGSKLYTSKFAVLARTNMPAALIENYFHTCRTDVEKLLTDDERDKLAYATACGICEYFNVGIDKLPEPDGEEEVDKDIIYTIQVGAFADETNADKMLEILKGKGVEGFKTTKG